VQRPLFETAGFERWQIIRPADEHSAQIDSNNAREDDAVESPGSADTGHPDGALLDPLKMEEIRADEWAGDAPAI